MSTEEIFEHFSHLIKKGDVLAVRNLLASGIDVNTRNRFGWTPLMLATGKGHTPIVSLLLSAGADFKAVNDFGASALAYAALEGECRTIQVLLDAGASVDVQPHGVNLLEFAGWGRGQDKTQKHFEILRKAGAK